MGRRLSVMYRSEPDLWSIFDEHSDRVLHSEKRALWACRYDWCTVLVYCVIFSDCLTI